MSGLGGRLQLGALTEWGNRYLDCEGTVTRVHGTCGESVRLRWYCTHCDEPAGRNITLKRPELQAAS